MGKYSPLRSYLLAQDKEQVPMSFAEIEALLGEKLPASKRYPAWWSNNPSNNPMTREWLAAGFHTESVNIAGERLVFRRVAAAAADSNEKRRGFAEAAQPDFKHAVRHPGFGFMKGLIKIEEGFDVTKPFDDEPWDEGYLGTRDRT